MKPSLLAVASLLVTLSGCVGEGADPSRAPNHPANPQATETSYSPPPNTLTEPNVPPLSNVTLAGPCASKTCPAGQRCMVMGTPPAPMCM